MPILPKQAVEALSLLLHLPLTDHEQDWDIKVADFSRIREFLTRYQQDSGLDQPQKHALMAVLLASCDQALQEGKSIEVSDWKQIQTSLYTDPGNQDLIYYWAQPGVEDVNQHFHLTPYIRSRAY